LPDKIGDHPGAVLKKSLPQLRPARAISQPPEPEPDQPIDISRGGAAERDYIGRGLEILLKGQKREVRRPLFNTREIVVDAVNETVDPVPRFLRHHG
jgi:hypothetical protein